MKTHVHSATRDTHSLFNRNVFPLHQVHVSSDPVGLAVRDDITVDMAAHAGTAHAPQDCVNSGAGRTELAQRFKSLRGLFFGDFVHAVFVFEVSSLMSVRAERSKDGKHFLQADLLEKRPRLVADRDASCDF